ncbi:hypothetical protein [Haloarcula rubripromontorii]|jgi:hypothetical protein|uniref:hypothetical protein n=1 Tax=Haloarcula rubripromontorii TaxID=1705562 RepID=UPI00345BAB85
MMDRYGGLVDEPGVRAGNGESWEEAARRLRGQTRRLHPLARKVADAARGNRDTTRDCHEEDS